MGRRKQDRPERNIGPVEHRERQGTLEVEWNPLTANTVAEEEEEEARRSRLSK